MMMWRYKLIILVAVTASMFLGIVYLVNAVPVYSSSSRIYVEQTGPRIMRDMEEGVMTGSNNYLYTQAELIRAAPIIEEALQTCQADAMRTFESIDNPIGYLKQMVNTSVGRADDIIEVSFRSPHRTEAAQVVNAIVDSYVTFHSRRKRSTSLEVLKILQGEKAARSQELSSKLQEIVTFKEQHEGLIYQTEQGNIIIQRLSRLSDALTDAQLAALEGKSAFEASKSMIADANGLKQFVDAYRNRGQSFSVGADLERMRARLDEFRLLRSDRLRKLKEDHPAIKVLDNEIARLESQIIERDEQFALAQIAIMEQQYLATKERTEELEQHYQQYYQEAVELNRQIDRYAVLQSQYEQIQRSCDILDERIKELNITEDVGAMNITILEVAHASSRPCSPSRAKIMMLAIFVGFMTGGAGVWARDMMNVPITSADEAGDLLNVPILGTVPTLPRRSSLTERGQVILNDPISPAAESIRAIRTSIFFSARDQVRLIHVTSAFPGAGKSTLVSNLGIALAQSGKRTLIVDGDLRRPVQHTIFDIHVKREKGLTSVLAGLCPLRDAIFSTHAKGLDLLVSGPHAANPAELLGSERFKNVLTSILTRYESILIDSPPIVPVADGSILAAVCDATIIVVRTSKTKRKGLLRSREAIMRVGADIIGCVVNDVPRGDVSCGNYTYGNLSPGNGNGKKRQRKCDSQTEESIIGKRLLGATETTSSRT
ncbi:GumC family protein [Planctomycetota bacterium]